MQHKVDNAVPTAFTAQTTRRRAIPMDQVVDVHVDPSIGSFILQVHAKVDGILLASWAKTQTTFLADMLRQYGAVLFRGFCTPELQDFHEFVNVACGRPLEYRERSSPRSLLKAGIYSSTDYPADQRIFFHNENSYQHQWPQKIIFYCILPAEQGGETTLSEIRRVTSLLSPRIRQSFEKKGILYQRNYRPDLGLPWQTVFQATSRDEVDQYCHSVGIKAEWITSDHLRTFQTRRAIVRHPQTGEDLWFNHAAFFHISTLPSSVREVLLANFEPEDMPNNSYYGDGSAIDDSIVKEIRDVYENCSAKFQWSSGDVLVLDNMLVAHSREPYRGPRKVAVSMVEPVSGNSLEKN